MPVVAMWVVALLGAGLAVAPIRAPGAEAATTNVAVPLSEVRAMKVDPTTGRIYLTGDNEVRVYEPNGAFVTSVTGLFGAYAMDIVGTTLWVAQSTAGKVSSIDTSTFTITDTYTLGTTVNDTLAVVGGGIWVNSSTSGFVPVTRYDIGNGTLTNTTATFSSPGVARIPNDNTHLLVYDRGSSGGQVSRINSTTGAVELSKFTDRYLNEFTVSDDGSMFWASGVGDSPEFSTTTLTTTGVAYPSEVGAATAGAGGVLAGRQVFTNDVWVARAGQPNASHIIAGLEPDRLALSIDGLRLFSITDGNNLRIDTLAPTGTATPNIAVAGVPSKITVNGIGLGATSAAALGGQAASYEGVTPTQVVVTVPAGVAPGTRQLRLSSVFGNLNIPITVQANTGATLAGTVTAGLAPVPGIQLTLSGGPLVSNLVTTSGIDGTYSFAPLAYGITYALQVHDPANNFADQTIRDLTIEPNGTKAQDIDLLNPPVPQPRPAARLQLPAPADVHDLELDPATNRVFVTNGDEIDIFDAAGALLKRLQGQWGAHGIAIAGGSAYVVNRSAAEVVRINTTSMAITGTWPLDSDTNGEIAFAGGRVWFFQGTLDGSIASLDPANGAIATSIDPVYDPRLSQVMGDSSKFLLSSGLSDGAVVMLSVSGGVASFVTGATDVFRPVLANASTQHMWSFVGKQYHLNPLAPDGVVYPGTGPLGYSGGHGGLVQLGTTIMQEGVPLRTHHLPTTSVANALDAAAEHSYLATDDGYLEVWDLAPQIVSVDPAPVPPVATTLTVTGQGFGITTGVTVDGSAVPFSALSTEQLHVDVPAMNVGVHQLRVSNLSGTSAPFALTVADLTVPSAPLAVAATPGGLSAEVTWTPPANNGGSPILAYTATATPGGAECTSLLPGCTITGLTAGAPYTVTVVATNAQGPGPASDPSNEVLPTEVLLPGPPTNAAALAGPEQAHVSWAPPADDGGAPILGYTITPYVGAVAQTPLDVGPVTDAVVGGLDAGTEYTFTVAAINVVGPSAESVASNAVTPTAATLPSPPLGVTASPGSEKVTVSWLAPATSGGASITGYTVTAEPGGGTCDTSGALSCQVDGLTNGTNYSFTVTAHTSLGTSDPSAPSTSVTPVAPAGAAFHALPPKRILDSRPATQVGNLGTPWGPKVVRSIVVAPAGGVPSGAEAVALNVTVTDTTSGSHLTVWPTGTTQPTASNLNWLAGTAIANAVTVKVGDGGKISLFNNLGSANVIVDVVGYYDDLPGDGYTSQSPQRIIDSRPGTNVGPYNTPWHAGESRPVQVAGVGDVPAEATAVVVNTTVTGTTGGSFLTLSPTGLPRPLASSMNWVAGKTIANAVTVKVGAAGNINVYNDLGNADVILDVVGYFTTGTGTLFHPLDPKRVIDSRPATKIGPFGTPWTAQTSRNFAIPSSSGVPVLAVSALLNATATGTTAVSYLTVWPGATDQPLASTLNWSAGQTVPNSATARLGPHNDVWIYNDAGNVDVVLDVNGWYG